jgi:hypothetical protein
MVFIARGKKRGELVLAAAALCSPALCRAQNAPAPPSTQPTPQVRVEYFGAERGYTVGHSDVVLLCVVRNIGITPVPEKTLRLHCYPVAGLDYTQGDLAPDLPALAPNQAVAFRWRLTPSESRQALIAAAQVENQGPSAPILNRPSSEPPVTLTVVPHFDSPPRFGAPIAGADLIPQAGAVRSEAWLSGNRVALRLLASDRDEPLLLLAARAGAVWQLVATGLPLARVRACEDGQTPWWATFRWRRAQTREEKDRATLTLSGNIGSGWNADIILEARRDTSAIEGRLRLTARRTLRLYAVQLPRLMATAPDNADPQTAPVRADGSPTLLPEADPTLLPDDARVMAARQSGVTYGLTWPLNPPFAGWTWNRLPSPGNGMTAPGAVGAFADRASNGEVVLPGASVEVPFRLFAFGPSDTIRDALRFIMP